MRSKGVGEKAVEAIVAERKKNGKFKDLYELCERLDSKSVNKSCLESLIKAGALESIAGGNGRASLMGTLEDAMSSGARIRDDKNSGQGNLFGGDDAVAPRPRMAQVAEWTEKQRLDEEKAVLGFYFSGHPLDEARELVEGISSSKIRDLSRIPEGYEVVIGAYVTQVQPRITRMKGEKMAVLTVEDFSGNTQVVVFPKTYDRFKQLLQPDTILFFKGRLKSNEMNGGAGGANGKGGANGANAEGDDARPPSLAIMADEIMTVDEAAERYVSDVTLLLDEQDCAGEKVAKQNGHPNGNGSGAKAQMQSVLALMHNFSGRVPLYFSVDIESGPGAPATVAIRGGDKTALRPAPDLFAGLRKILKSGQSRAHQQRRLASCRKPADPPWKRRSA